MEKLNVITFIFVSSLIFSSYLCAKNLLSTFVYLKSQLFKGLMFPPTHLFHVEQITDLSQCVNVVRSIKTIREIWKPFNIIAPGRPTLCSVGAVYHYHDDIKDASKTSGINL